MSKRRTVSGKRPNLLWLRGQIKEMIQDQLRLQRQPGEGPPPFPPPAPFGFPNSEHPPQRRTQPPHQAEGRWEGPPPPEYWEPHPPSMNRRQSPRSNNQPAPPGPPSWIGPGPGMMDGPPVPPQMLPQMPPQAFGPPPMRPFQEPPAMPQRRPESFGPPPGQGNIAPYHDPMMPPAPWRRESPQQQAHENRPRNHTLASPHREWEEMPESFDETLVVDSRRQRIRRKR